PPRAQGPLSAGVALPLDAVAYHRRGQPLAGFLFVQVSRIDGQQVDLVPRRGQEDLRGGLGQAGALLDGDLRRGVADVVAENLAHQALERGPVAPLGDRFHDLALGAEPDGPETGTLSRRGFVLIGWPVPPPRAAGIAAIPAGAISGADFAPMSSPIGTRTRLSAASLSPSSARSFRIAAPRRIEPSMPM